MGSLHRLLGLLLIAAIFNPVCCCYAGMLAADAATEPAAHPCCGGPAPAPNTDSNPTSCPGDGQCPHSVRLVESVAGHHATPDWALLAKLAPVESFLSAWAIVYDAPANTLCPAPAVGIPGGVAVSAYLRTHALLF
jgi:hypothetical protein